MDTLDTTYRLIVLNDPGNVGLTAATPDLAKRAVGNLYRAPDALLAMERTEWADKYGKMVANRSVIMEAENSPNEWKIGL